MATQLQELLRFLSQDAKVPLATAMGKVKELQAAKLGSVDELAKAKANDLQAIFPDEKVAKQIVTAAKRVSKKRAAGEDVQSPKKKRKNESLSTEITRSPEELEASLELPSIEATEEELSETVLFTNRAPLALAFVLTLLKFSMPEQPLSSRLSLAQGYISVTSKARAIYLGIESGTSAEAEGWGEGTHSVTITSKEIKVLRRWGYEWKAADVDESILKDGSAEDVANKGQAAREITEEANIEQQPPLWALDLESLKKSNHRDPIVASKQAQSGNNSNLPIYTPQSARQYIVKAFDTAASNDAKGTTTKKLSAAAKVAEKEQNLGKLLRALDLLYESWAVVLTPEELDKRTWGWYVKVRPDVAEGAAGWGGKNNLKLADILALRREV